MESGLATGTCDANRTSGGCSPAGTALKVGGSSGFDVVFAGDRSTNGSYYNQGAYAHLWSSSASGSGAWERFLGLSDFVVNRYAFSKEFGFSVRCLKD